MKRIWYNDLLNKFLFVLSLLTVHVLLREGWRIFICPSPQYFSSKVTNHFWIVQHTNKITLKSRKDSWTLENQVKCVLVLEIVLEMRANALETRNYNSCILKYILTEVLCFIFRCCCCFTCAFQTILMFFIGPLILLVIIGLIVYFTYFHEP